LLGDIDINRAQADERMAVRLARRHERLIILLGGVAQQATLPRSRLAASGKDGAVFFIVLASDNNQRHTGGL